MLQCKWPRPIFGKYEPVARSLFTTLKAELPDLRYKPSFSLSYYPMLTFSIILNILHFRAQTICNWSVLGLVICVRTLRHFSLQVKKMRCVYDQMPLRSSYLSFPILMLYSIWVIYMFLSSNEAVLFLYFLERIWCSWCASFS